ncbi:UDP-3-O-(3-hydroxymyristoyl)glucosamine N-acyltransferase [Pseudooceanicola spongiae]|uniref:UDP-3-O-(3-hydroxymyristoyl)glucosamine N-acyltransferase n=1 Tax=Pseudooceanicola spongiae TaxID=2613965 RepID=A0A7L9WJN2_9RHOB|nr:UDP-3-O-(3-hydroxymyristoyl)glucosamine N-acyltransferase [Pseudooceanicola spongiae]QOL80113.1 UDP-3-O-(3-hydroxymyristoyl)glucosamine N-acyltransferase [Pseudooceanicola spongiae]
MAHSIQDIANALGCEALGNTELTFNSVAEPASAGPDDLALAMKPEYAEALHTSQARMAILWEGADWQALGLEAALIAPRPRMAMASLTKTLDAGPGYSTGIHPMASIDDTAMLEEGVSVGAFTVIAAGARIGKGSVIGPQCYVGPDSELGAGALLHVGAKVGPRVRIGANFTLHPGGMIGADGFSFVTPEVNNVEKARKSFTNEVEENAQSWVRIHSLGAVIIGDNVEIGCYATIDAGTIRATEIKDGTKIDNHVHVGHNCIVGRDCLFAAFVGIAGSVTIGDNVVMGGQVGVSDNISIGNGVIATGGTTILSSVPAGRVLMGYPATKMETQLESYKALRRLPRLFKQVAELQKAVSKGNEND